MVSLKVNFQKKDLWLLSAIIIFIVGVGYVIAWGSGNPQLQGHDASELTGVCKTDGTGCPAGIGESLQTLQVIGITDITATSSWADMQDMTVTMNTNGGDV